MKTNFTISPELLQAPEEKRQKIVTNLAKALQIEPLDLHEHETPHLLLKSNFFEDPHSEHLMEPIGRLERQLYELIDVKGLYKALMRFFGIPKKFWQIEKSWIPMRKSKWDNVKTLDGSPLTEEQWNRLNNLFNEYLDVPREQIEDLIVKANMAAREYGEQDMGERDKVSKIKTLPTSIQSAVKVKDISPQHANMLQYAVDHAVINLTHTTEVGKHLVLNVLLDSLSRTGGVTATKAQRMEHTRSLAHRLFQEMGLADTAEGGKLGFLNRDWLRVAITEANDAAANGYLMGLSPGELVAGIAHPDACSHCTKLIAGRIYKLTADPPESMDSAEEGSAKYKALVKRWQTELWIGKSNYGLRLSPRKREGGKLVPRKPHELAKATIPLHPWCRCRWMRINPEVAYVNGSGEITYLTPGKPLPDAYKRWVQREPLVQEKLRQMRQDKALMFLKPDELNFLKAA